MNYCPHCGHKLDGKYVLCPECRRHLRLFDGSGSSGGSQIVPCAYCKGEGKIDTGRIFNCIIKVCPACGGAGAHRI